MLFLYCPGGLKPKKMMLFFKLTLYMHGGRVYRPACSGTSLRRRQNPQARAHQVFESFSFGGQALYARWTCGVCLINFGFNNGKQLRSFRKRVLVARKLELLKEKHFLMHLQSRVVDRCFHYQRMAVLDKKVRLLGAQFMAVCHEARNRDELIDISARL